MLKSKKISENGGKKRRKIAQRLFSVGVSASLMLAMVPNNGAYADGSGFFYEKANPNHWGRSDLRAYLNNVEKVNDTLPFDSTTSGDRANYLSRFGKAEYNLVQPFTYSTNVIDENLNATSTYETTDKFWLPSGNYDNYQIISWGSGDISANSQYLQTTTYDKDHIIPISYWSYGNPTYSWLRSPDYDCDFYALLADRGHCVGSSNVLVYNAAAAACKIHLESVIFASAASAASIAAAGGAKKIDISGSSDFGKKTSNSLPDYGMYLKTSSNDSFAANSLTLSDTNLTVNYSGGVADQYVVVHAFKEDSLTGGHTSYVAAKELEDGQSSATINVSNWGIDSLDGYTIKVWMEDGSGSLAKATTPETFVGSSGSISKTTSGEIKNPRVFAMKDELQCSWGNLSALSAEDYDDVILGNIASENGGVMGSNPTNQKIYFGGMEFWIAGRETAANAGSVSATGDIMTLYQAKSDEIRPFNASGAGYDEILNTAETTVELPGFGPQRIMVRGSYDVLPEGTQLVAKVVPVSPDIDPQNYDVEHKFHYEIKLVDKNGNQLPMPLAKKVELLFEVVKGLDKDDLEVILAQVGEDLQFEENLVNLDGVDYVGVWTNHFSPYTLIDKLTDEEKAAMMKTGDEGTYFTIATMGLIMALALGLMINSRANKKKFD